MRTLAPANYTAIVRGKNDSTGVGLVGVYDLSRTADSRLANTSSRGFVETGEDVMIGGFIVGSGRCEDARVVVRAIGPSLSGQGITNALQDPTLELIDGNGSVIAANDDWKTGQRAELEAMASRQRRTPNQLSSRRSRTGSTRPPSAETTPPVAWRVVEVYTVAQSAFKV